jgi:hypothetical protein
MFLLFPWLACTSEKPMKFLRIYNSLDNAVRWHGNVIEHPSQCVSGLFEEAD